MPRLRLPHCEEKVARATNAAEKKLSTAIDDAQADDVNMDSTFGAAAVGLATVPTSPFDGKNEETCPG